MENFIAGNKITQRVKVMSKKLLSDREKLIHLLSYHMGIKAERIFQSTEVENFSWKKYKSKYLILGFKYAKLLNLDISFTQIINTVETILNESDDLISKASK